jgi:hypothetical protein
MAIPGEASLLVDIELVVNSMWVSINGVAIMRQALSTRRAKAPESETAALWREDGGLDRRVATYRSATGSAHWK